MNFNIYVYRWECVTCKTQPESVQVGVNSLCELVALWQCQTCGEDIICRVPFEKLMADVKDIPPVLRTPLNEGDKALLANAKITWEEK